MEGALKLFAGAVQHDVWALSHRCKIITQAHGKSEARPKEDRHPVPSPQVTHDSPCLRLVR